MDCNLKPENAPNTTPCAAQEEVRLWLDDPERAEAFGTVVTTDSGRVAQQLEQGDLSATILAKAAKDIPDHQRITIDDRFCAVATTVDALVFATSDRSDAPAKTLSNVLSHHATKAKPPEIYIGASRADTFLAIFAASEGRLPSQASPMTLEEAQRSLRPFLDLSRVSEFTSPALAVIALDTGDAVAALVPFGALSGSHFQPIAAPLRLTPDGAPVAILGWSGWGLSADATIDPNDVQKSLMFDDLGNDAAHKGVWLLDGFTPDAEHSALLETIAAGAVLAPTDLWYARLRSALTTTLARGDADDADTLARQILAGQSDIDGP